MESRKIIVYMVTYKDDFNKKHITFVTSFSEIRFLKDRFEIIHYEQLK